MCVCVRVCVTGVGGAEGHVCVYVCVGGGDCWDSDAGGKGQAMQSICCADAGRGQLLGEIRCCCSSSLEAILLDSDGVNFL